MIYDIQRGKPRIVLISGRVFEGKFRIDAYRAYRLNPKNILLPTRSVVIYCW
ncbi:hypothetical protein BT69DRAFT_1278832 [Atractiella rhizophila]|nr:hypothetical protein BT69DRAFT_1278832 [Atractiella rhizophila]